MSGNKIYNIFINSANRKAQENVYDFDLYFDNDEIIVKPNEGININVVSFSMMNSMYNVNQYTKNNTFILTNKSTNSDTTFTIPYGNYNVYTFMAELNLLLAGIINVSYNVATNTYTYKNLTLEGYNINPSNCSKLLGLIKKTDISAMSSITSGFVNMVDYQQVILRCPTLVFESNSMDNIQDQDDFISVSDILYWINKQDVEPFKMINYKNEDCSTLYSYNIINRNINRLNFKLGNEYNEPIYDAPDYLLQLQISVYEKDANFFKEATIQAIKLLNDIYFTLLNIINLMIKK
jgi:hypothetical protein